MAIFCQILTDLRNFFTPRFLDKLAVRWSSKILPLLAYVATLPCKTLMSENKRLTINYKAVYSYIFKVAYVGVVNNQVKKVFIAKSASEKFLKSVNIYQTYKQERGCIEHFLRLLAM